MTMTGVRRGRAVPALLLTVLAGSLAACGGGDDEETTTAAGGDAAATTAGATSEAAPARSIAEPTEPVTVRFASWIGQGAEIQKMAKDFKKLHPNITIKFENTPAEAIDQKLTTQIAGGNAPDAAYVNGFTVADYAQRGALADLDEYIAGSEVIDPDDYVPAFKQTAVFEDSMFALPFAGESTGLFYRTDLFEEAGIAGPPKTWDEFKAAAEKLTKPEKKQYGTIVFAPESAYYFYPWLYQVGGDVLSKDGKEVVINSEEGKRAAEFYVSLKDYSPKDYLNSNSYDGRVAFANGTVAMYVAGAWFAGVLTDEFPKIKGKWDAAPLPEGDKCGTTIAGDNLVVFEESENKDAAWLWIEYLSRPENMKLYTVGAPASTLLPPVKSMLEDPATFEKKPILKGFAEAMACGPEETGSNPNAPKIEEALNRELGRALYGEQTGPEALDAAAAEAQQILRRAD
jgi:multiple sugar transport system substrate-binding protein